MTTDILGPAHHIIGSRYVESVQAYVLELTGLEVVKVVTSIADTLEYHHNQVRIDVDEDGNISGLRHG